MGKLIAIEGLVAAGKSSLLKLLESNNVFPNATFIHEPVREFCYFRGHNPLFLSYREPVLNSGFTQMHIINCVCNRHCVLSKDPIDLVITERSIDSPLVFTKAQYQMGIYTDFVKDYILNYYKIKTKNHRRPDVIIFINVSFHTLAQRLQERSRNEEVLPGKLPIDSLQSELYKQYIIYLEQKRAEGCIVLTVEADNCTLSDLCSKIKTLIIENQ